MSKKHRGKFSNVSKPPRASICGFLRSVQFCLHQAQIHTCCSHDASASLTQGVTPLFHLGLAPTSPLHYLSLKIFVTFDLLPPSLCVTADCVTFELPSPSLMSQSHFCLVLASSSPPIIVTGTLSFFVLTPRWSQTCLTYLALSLRFSHLFLIHYSLTFAEDHFGLSRPFLSLTRSHISSLWSLSFDRAEDEIHNLSCRKNQPIICSEKSVGHYL